MAERLLNAELFKRGLRVLVPMMVPLIVIFVVYIYREMQLLGLPDIGDPFDVEAFANVQIPDEDNAYIEYSRAATMVVLPTRDDYEYAKALAYGWDGASENIRKWVAKNAATLDVWRKGTEKPDAFQKGGPLHIHELRQLSWFIPLKCIELEQQGDLREAWNWNRALFRYSRHVGMRGGGIHRLTGIAFLGVAADSAVRWSRNEKVDETLLTDALKDISSIYQMTAKPDNTFKWNYVEYMQQLDALRAKIRSWSDLKDEVQSFLQHEPVLSRRVAQHSFEAGLQSLRDAGLDSENQSGDQRRSSDRTSLLTTSDLTAAELNTFAQRSLYNGPSSPRIGKFPLVIRREQFRQRALEMALAARIYFRRHGRYPDALEQIVAILEQAGVAAPRDPFGESGTLLRYRLDEQRMVIWTVGEHGDPGPDQLPETDGLPVSGWLESHRTFFIPLDTPQGTSPAATDKP